MNEPAVCANGPTRGEPHPAAERSPSAPSGHLNDDELAALVVGEGSAAGAAHAATCARCAAELASLHELGAALRLEDEAVESRPAGAWVAQRSAIAERLRRPGTGYAWRLLLAGGAAAALALTLTLWPATPPPGSTSPADDRELLAGIAAALDRPTPAALAPALLLAGELERGMALAAEPATATTQEIRR